MMRRIVVCLALILAIGWPLVAQDEAPYVIVFHEPRTEVAAIVLPIDPNPRIQFQPTGAMAFGLMVDNRHNLCCGAGAIRTTFKLDNRVFHPNVPGQGQPLPADRFGKPRKGFQTNYVIENVSFTQWLEVIPSRAGGPGVKRSLDTVIVRYLIENRDTKSRSVGTRVRIDTMCGQNDGALFAAPTKPGEILNGVELKDKTLPEYVQILEVPNLKAPGFVGHFTLKLPGNRIGPDRFLCTAHGAGDNGWDTPVVQSQGDSDCALFWSPREVKAGEKIEMAYAYGQGIASLPESEGRVKITLGGSFEPGKLFTVQASVEEPMLGQTLSLELPAGLTLVEGRPLQPAAPASEQLATAVAIWKGRVERLGEFPLTIRSSNGITETRTVTVGKR